MCINGANVNTTKTSSYPAAWTVTSGDAAVGSFERLGGFWKGGQIVRAAYVTYDAAGAWLGSFPTKRAALAAIASAAK